MRWWIKGCCRYRYRCHCRREVGVDHGFQQERLCHLNKKQKGMEKKKKKKKKTTTKKGKKKEGFLQSRKKERGAEG